jgi:hypoxanthine phosphoribosyltransferase
MEKDLKKILLDENAIKKKIEKLGNQISQDYKGKKPILVCILRGAVIFLSDLMRSIDIPVQIDFMSLSSYGDSTQSSGVVKIRKDIDVDIVDRDVIIVEDIVDSGLTLDYIFEYLQKHNPASVKICTLLDKPEAHKTDLKLDYVGYEIENEFVVGYGLDFAEKYRNLPYIGILKKEIYT